ncbi:MAG TPA: hypothetical protein VKU01_12050 [Bryobacteraceae bacterium]|nr:hypothetical protein [Bryobacteraceae bacterium]
MKMNKIAPAVLFAAVAGAGLLQAQPDAKLDLGPLSRVYVPKYLTAGNRANHVGEFVQRIFSGINVYWEPLVNGYVIQERQFTSPPSSPANQELLDRVEAMLKRMDVPEPPSAEKGVEFTIYLLRANSAGDDKAGAIPPDLASAVAEMKRTLPYSRFTLADTIVTTVHSSAKVEGVLREDFKPSSAPPYYYRLEFGTPRVSGDGKTVSLQQFEFHIDIPENFPTPQLKPIGISTDLVIHENQKLVLGKIPLSGTDRDDLWLVVTAKAK